MKAKTLQPVQNENGSVMIIALIILALLTLIGISSNTTTSIELQIAANDKFQKIAFYAAESGWQRTVNWLDGQFPMITNDVGTDTGGGGLTFTDTNYSATPDDTVQDVMTLNADNNARYFATAAFAGTSPAPGYSTDFKRVNYLVSSVGYGPQDAESGVDIACSKITYVGGY